ncbi:MAG: hypothetical protein AB4057_10915 [Crocosphaera sp.]
METQIYRGNVSETSVSINTASSAIEISTEVLNALLSSLQRLITNNTVGIISELVVVIHQNYLDCKVKCHENYGKFTIGIDRVNNEIVRVKLENKITSVKLSSAIYEQAIQDVSENFKDSHIKEQLTEALRKDHLGYLKNHLGC